MMPTLRAELTKALTLRTVHAAALGALLAPPALALASGLAFDPDAAALFPAESHGFETAGLGQPLVIVLAALITGAEYVDGQLRSTLLATPRRGRALGAKLLVIAAAAALIGALSTAAAVLVKHALLGEHGLAPSHFTAAMGWNLVGVMLNYTLIALIAAAITVLARTVVVTLVVLIPLVLGMTLSLLGVIPFVKYLPDLAGIQLLTGYPGVGLLDPLPGGLVMAAWTLALQGAAWERFLRRDVGGS